MTGLLRTATSSISASSPLSVTALVRLVSCPVWSSCSSLIIRQAVMGLTNATGLRHLCSRTFQKSADVKGSVSLEEFIGTVVEVYITTMIQLALLEKTRNHLGTREQE